MTKTAKQTETFTQLLADAEVHTQLLLLKSIFQSVKYWGERTAKDYHEAEQRIEELGGRDVDTNQTDVQRYRADRADTQLKTLRKMYTALSQEIKALEIDQAVAKATADANRRENLGVY